MGFVRQLEQTAYGHSGQATDQQAHQCSFRNAHRRHLRRHKFPIRPSAVISRSSRSFRLADPFDFLGPNRVPGFEEHGGRNRVHPKRPRIPVVSLVSFQAERNDRQNRRQREHSRFDQKPTKGVELETPWPRKRLIHRSPGLHPFPQRRARVA